jgi:hypothetical protein
MMTRLATSTVYVVAAVLIVASLALSVPASCWCARDTHAGMLLHPIFPHHHGNASASYVGDDDAPPVSDAERASASITPALSGPLGEAGPGGIGGSEILLPMLLAAALLLSARFHVLDPAVADQHLASPLTPPPRAWVVVH